MENGMTMGPIEQFLAECEKRLSGRLAADKVAATLSYARSYMTHRAEELAAGGLEPAVALATAASAFGTAQQWTSQVLRAENYKPYVVPANYISIVSFALLLLVVPLGTLAFKTMATGDTKTAGVALIVGVVVTLLASIGAPIGALIAGRCDLKMLGAIAGAATLLGFLVVGQAAPTLMSIMSQGTSMGDLESNQKERKLLELGVQTYGDQNAPASPPAVLPPDLKGDGGFLAPKENFRSFKMSAMFNSADGASQWSANSDNRGMETLPTQAAAAKQWRAFGAARLAACDQDRLTIQRELIHHTSAPAASFAPLYAWKAAGVVLFQGCWWAGWCLLLAWIGRSSQEARAKSRLQKQWA